MYITPGSAPTVFALLLHSLVPCYTFVPGTLSHYIMYMYIIENYGRL